jgi:predicted PurR-regulated permease PerM
LGLLAALAWKVRGVLLPFAFALMWTYLLSPLVAYVERWGWPPGLSVLAVYGALAVVLAGAVFLLGPPLAQEGHQLVRALPTLAAKAQRGVDHLVGGYHRLPLPPALRREVDGWLGMGEAWLLERLRGAAWSVGQGLTVAASLAVSPILAYYSLRDRRRWAAVGWRRCPVRWRRRLRAVVGELDRVVGGFVRGQILVSAVVGVLALGVTLAFGLPYPLLVAAVAAATDLIPYLGPILGAFPAVGFAFLRSPWEALWVFLSFLAIHEAEGTLLSPWILGEEVGMHPLAVLLSVLVGGDLFGVVGMVVAVPCAAALAILVRFGLHELEGWVRRPWPGT